MVGVREHIYRLNGLYFIFRIEQLQVARLRSRISTDIYDAFGLGKQNDIHYILVHSGTGRVGDDNIRTSMLVDKFLSQNILHVTCIKQGILNIVDFCVHLCVFNGFRHILDTNHLTSPA